MTHPLASFGPISSSLSVFPSVVSGGVCGGGGLVVVSRSVHHDVV